MKLLLRAALRSKKHLSFAFLTLVLLLLMTVANGMERFSLGLMVDTGADFFALFGSGKSKDRVYLEEVQKKWDKIDKNHRGRITKKQAANYLSKRKTSNPLQKIFYRLSKDFDLEKNFVDLLWLLISIAIFKAIILFFSRYATQVLSIRVTRDLRQQYFEHMQSLQLDFYHKHDMGALSTRAVGDAGQIAAALNSLLTNYLQTPFTIVFSLGACFTISWQLSCVIFFGLPLIFFPVMFLTKRVKAVSRQMQKNQETFSSVLLDFLSGIHTIKVFAREHFSLKKYRSQNEKMAKLETKSAMYYLLTRPVLHLITTSCLAFVVIFGMYYLHMTISELLVFCAVLHLFYEPVKKFSEENANIQKGVVAAERMFEVIDQKPKIVDSPDAEPFTEFKDKIEFKNVYFAYKDEWVLKDFSCTIEKGQTLAIVGPTGSGKSTIVQLLPRLYDVQKGEILIDGKPLSQYTQKSIRDQIAFVPQKPFLFFDSVFENISFGQQFSIEEIIHAAKKAYAHEFIMQLPEGYDTKLAEAGKSLSGGEQQRMVIARAFIKNSPILVMDEATSSLDAISENKIRSAIVRLPKNVTKIIIAHRLSTIEHADKILYIDKGKKIAEGTKDELLQNSKEFKKMWDQFHRIEEAAVIGV